MMKPISQYEGDIRLCKFCGQPCFQDSDVWGEPDIWGHFQEQWDGALCSYFPLAVPAGPMQWDPDVLAALKASYDGRSWYHSGEGPFRG